MKIKETFDNYFHMMNYWLGRALMTFSFCFVGILVLVLVSVIVLSGISIILGLYGSLGLGLIWVCVKLWTSIVALLYG
jgi:hypothetical protein